MLGLIRIAMFSIQCIENGTFLSLDYIIIGVIIFVHLQTCAQPSENTNKNKVTFQSKKRFSSLNHLNICELPKIDNTRYVLKFICLQEYEKRIYLMTHQKRCGLHHFSIIFY